MAINLSGISISGGGGGGGSTVGAKLRIIPVDVLPDAASASRNAIYIIKSKKASTDNKFDEDIVVDGESGPTWELFGRNVTIDLTPYALKTEVSKKQDKLVNQQNIRSINGISLLGEGDIPLETFTADEKHNLLALIDSAITDAPADGKQYARKDGEWSEVEAAGGSTEDFVIGEKLFCDADILEEGETIVLHNATVETYEEPGEDGEMEECGTLIFE